MARRVNTKFVITMTVSLLMSLVLAVSLTPSLAALIIRVKPKNSDQGHDVDLALHAVGLPLFVECHDDDGRAVAAREARRMNERLDAFLEARLSFLERRVKRQGPRSCLVEIAGGRAER